VSNAAWLSSPEKLKGHKFAEFHRGLATYNAMALEPSFPSRETMAELEFEAQVRAAEIAYLHAVRREIRSLASDIPTNPDDFMAWYERLERDGPGQHDALFPWLAKNASLNELKWFLWQEVAGEAGFEDLLALTQVKMPKFPKLEMARNYWDEMGRGRHMAMHGPLLQRLAEYFNLAPTPNEVVPQALALGNAMLAMARNRRFAFHSIGALGVIEMTAPARAAFVNDALKRLGVPAKKRLYFAVHAVLDVKHSEEWNKEVLRPLVAEDPRRAVAIGEGALIRLWHGARCFDVYRDHFQFESGRVAA
jgi:hypothetical protein